MFKDDWIPIKEISDDSQIWSGTKVRVFGVNNYEKEFYDYIVSNIYDNNEYFQLTCLSRGEAGNIICVLQKEPRSNYVLGKELKRMMDYNEHSVFVNFYS